MKPYLIAIGLTLAFALGSLMREGSLRKYMVCHWFDLDVNDDDWTYRSYRIDTVQYYVGVVLLGLVLLLSAWSSTQPRDPDAPVCTTYGRTVVCDD